MSTQTTQAQDSALERKVSANSRRKFLLDSARAAGAATLVALGVGLIPHMPYLAMLEKVDMSD